MFESPDLYASPISNSTCIQELTGQKAPMYMKNRTCKSRGNDKDFKGKSLSSLEQIVVFTSHFLLHGDLRTMDRTINRIVDALLIFLRGNSSVEFIVTCASYTSQNSSSQSCSFRVSLGCGLKNICFKNTLALRSVRLPVQVVCVCFLPERMEVWKFVAEFTLKFLYGNSYF